MKKKVVIIVKDTNFRTEIECTDSEYSTVIANFINDNNVELDQLIILKSGIVL